MPIPERIAALHEEMTAWRRDIHAHPELGFQEQRTSALVAEKLQAFGLEVHKDIGKTGIVGVLRAGSSKRSVGLRADMDCLPIQELNSFGYKSRHDGRMHACGHDGHTTMLLGAARYLAATKNFDGTVNFIFQPAEEGLGGAKAMQDWPGTLDRLQEITAPTLGDPIKIKIPAESRSGHKLRIKGKGMPAEGDKRGDLYFVLQVTLPSPLSAEERRAYEQMARTPHPDPRADLLRKAGG